ncbi:hypothetical protein [Thalassobacillus devorans]|uniref:hypothetical protein n=1 Tax=Thalassobacillus devorans TaxID=279813 RepID=UPI00048D0A1F|nr:hypothetical protein [Thalassobacillus devorans]
MWLFLGLLALLASPIVFMLIREKFGWDTNRFYGDELNKEKRTLKDEAYDKSAKHVGGHDFGGSNHNHEGDGFR